jgi:NADPH:quinone reductase
MRAVQISDLGGPESLRLVDVPEPTDTDKVVVDVHAAGVSFPDLLMSQGLYQARLPIPAVLGCEAAGVVRHAPSESRWQSGDRVIAAVRIGAWAEVVAIDEDDLFRLPEAMSFSAGAGLLMNYTTMHFAYRLRCTVGPGQSVLVHGAAGGIGVAATELARAYGMHTIAVVSSAPKAELARAAGAQDVVEVDGWRAAVQRITSGRGVDYVVDPVGGDRFLDSVRSLAPMGKLLVIGFAAGKIPSIEVNRLLLKNVDVVGVNYGGWLVEHPEAQQRQWEDIETFIRSGSVRGAPGAIFALEDAKEALQTIAERRAVGKVVLQVR